jgi:dethiobiotin synthetase
MPSGVFITGTDTGVGKTRIAALLVRGLRQLGIDAVGVKPFCCGDRSDAEELLAASDSVIQVGQVNPVWLRVPASPFTASMVENRALDVETARDTIHALANKHSFLVIEGVGGWRVPLTQQLCMSQFAQELGFPVIVVVANRLGALNHTQLTLDSIRHANLPCPGVLLNNLHHTADDAATLTNKAVLEQLIDVPILGEIPHGAQSLPESALNAIRAVLVGPERGC